jgi:hypothetical protein
MKPTQADKTRHDLTIAQLNAVDCLASGKDDAETAAAVGVTRQTVNGWRNHHPAFIAALNARRLDIWGEAADRLRALLPKAVAALETALSREEPDWRAAVQVIELAGLDRQGHGVPNLGPSAIGPTDADAVIEAEVRRRRRDPLLDLVGGGPVTEGERRAVLRELAVKLGE